MTHYGSDNRDPTAAAADTQWMSFNSGLKLLMDQAINLVYSFPDVFDAGDMVDFTNAYSLRQDALEVALQTLNGLNISSPSRTASGQYTPFVVIAPASTTQVDFSVVINGVETRVRIWVILANGLLAPLSTCVSLAGCLHCETAQLNTSLTPLYNQFSGGLVFATLFNSTALFLNGTQYATFKAVSTTPSGVLVNTRVVPIVNPPSSLAYQLSFNFTSTNSSAAFSTAGYTNVGNYGFSYVSNGVVSRGGASALSASSCACCWSRRRSGSAMPFAIDLAPSCAVTVSCQNRVGRQHVCGAAQVSIDGHAHHLSRRLFP